MAVTAARGDHPTGDEHGGQGHKEELRDEASEVALLVLA